MGKTKFAAVLASAVAFTAAPASSAVTNYVVSGSFSDGSALSGSFGVDSNATGTFDQFQGINLSVGGVGIFDRFIGASFIEPSTSTSLYQLLSYDNSTFTVLLSLRFVAAHEGYKIVSIANQSFATGTYYSRSNGTPIQLVTGNISPSLVAAVPESATWAMMIVGFSMIGVATRYSRRATKISYT